MGNCVARQWYVFWAGGVRLFLAGLRQAFTPKFTAREIFEMKGEEALPIVQELGFANLSMGALCLVAPFIGAPLAGAIVSGLYYGLAGFRHLTSREHRNAQRTLAMATDFLVFAVLATYVTFTAWNMSGAA